MTHLLGVLSKGDIIPNLGSKTKNIHKEIRKSKPNWYYWYEGIVVWTNRKGKLEFKSPYPHENTSYPLLQRKDITGVMTTWGCASNDKPDLIKKIKKLTPRQIENLSLLPYSSSGKMAVTNKGDFSEDSRKKFGKQEIVRKTESGCEIGYWIKKKYKGSEDELIDEIREKGLDKLLSWVKIPFCVLIESPKNLIAHNSGRELHYFENSKIAVVSSVKSAISKAVKEFGFDKGEIKSVGVNKTKIFSRD